MKQNIRSTKKLALAIPVLRSIQQKLHSGIILKKYLQFVSNVNLLNEIIRNTAI